MNMKKTIYTAIATLLFSFRLVRWSRKYIIKLIRECFPKMLKM